jgi:FixJ family two-component response regulator
MNAITSWDFTTFVSPAETGEAILVIDDDLDWLSECQVMLQMLGYVPHCASNREEAMEHIVNHEIATVITDYSMPGCDGLTLMQDLIDFAARGGRTLRFIMATGHASMEIAVAAIRAHVTDFLEKPIAHDQLSTALLRARGVELEGRAKTDLVDHLGRLSQELQRISHLMAPVEAKSTEARPVARVGEFPTLKIANPLFIRRLLREENKRREIGNGLLFGDPSWSMLLDLLVAKMEGRKVAVSSACIASGAPTTTAMRLINRLVAETILVRTPDVKDGRRDYVTIDPTIENLLITYLNDLAKVE